MLGTLSEPRRGQMSHICDISPLRVYKQIKYVFETLTFTLVIHVKLLLCIILYFIYTEERLKTLTERALPGSENLTQMSDTSHTQDMDIANAPDTSKQLSKGTYIPLSSQIHIHYISSETRPGMSKSMSQSQQQFPVSTMPFPHNRKRISSPPVSPSSKRSKGVSPVLLDSEVITSQNSVESSITDNAADETIIDSSITFLKKRYAEMSYPTIIPSNEYHDLFIVDTKEKSIMNLENIGMLSDGTQAHCVIIEGSNGVGKTMLLHHLAKHGELGKVLLNINWFTSLLLMMNRDFLINTVDLAWYIATLGMDLKVDLKERISYFS